MGTFGSEGQRSCRRSADASFKGQVRYAQTDAGAEKLVQGDASLEDFRASTVVGLAKDVSVLDMETLLLASISVNDDNFRQLALQRGVVVRDYLASRKLPTERLFVGAAKAVSADAQWKPRAQLGVTQR